MECLRLVSILERSFQGLSLIVFSAGHLIIFSDCVRRGRLGRHSKVEF